MIKTCCVPIRVGAASKPTVGLDENGVKNTVYMAVSQSETPFILVSYNLDTGVCRSYPAPCESGAWACHAARDGFVYIGTYGTGRLMKFNPKTQTLTDLGQALPGETYVWDFAEDDHGHLYGGTYGGGKLFKVRLSTGTITDLGSFDPRIPYCRYLFLNKDGKIVCALATNPTSMGIYDPLTGEKTFVEFPEPITDPKYWGCLELFYGDDGGLYTKMTDTLYRIENDRFTKTTDSIKPKLGLGASKGRLLMEADATRLTVMHPNKQIQTFDLDYESAGASLFMMEKGPDGLIYGSSAIPLQMFRYDPKTQQAINLGNPSGVTGEIYSMATYDKRLFISAYSYAVVSVYDPSKPWNFGTDRSNNPHVIHKFSSHGQNRPKATIVGPDNRIYIGCVPNYGQTDGALIRLDPDTYDYAVWRGIVGKKSIESLCPIQGTSLICAGTTNECGGGAYPVPTDDALIFLFDTNLAQKTDERVAVKGQKTVVAIQHAQGIVYGLTENGYLFEYDVDEKSISTVTDMPFSHTIWPALAIDQQNHVLYCAGDERLYRVDLDTYKTDCLAHVPGWQLGFCFDESDQTVYGFVKGTLFSIDVGKPNRGSKTV